MDERETICALALGTAFGYEPVLSRRLTDALGGAAAVFELPEKERKALLSGLPQYAGALDGRRLEEAKRELAALHRTGCDFLPLSHDAFPALLKDCPDAPAGLWIRSANPPEAIFSLRPMLSVVGTRDCTSYGRECCRRAVHALKESGEKPCIVSGLALGIDICAHLAALDCGLPTVAVLPCGIDTVYPSRHIPTAGRIAEAPGSALVTDYPPGTAPLAHHFLRRNRIIAGMGRATLLVESRLRGGGMSTARLAAGYGREVFAIPGRVDDERSQGANHLIAGQVAQALEQPEAWGRALGLCEKPRKREDAAESARAFYGADADAGDLLSVMREVCRGRDLSLDELCRRTGYPYARVSALVMRLESDGFVETDLLQRCNLSFRGR
ncbi:MAG: DNA-protecting protein DprA [Bacteroidales bacterium]|nr:DNA-protecting protein DprA [Bacteroidales bacterium]